MQGNLSALAGVGNPLIVWVMDYRVTRELQGPVAHYDIEPVTSFVEAQDITMGPWAPRLDFTQAIQKFIV